MTSNALNALYDRIQSHKRELYALISWFQEMSGLWILAANDAHVPSITAEQTAARIAAMHEGIPGAVQIGGDARDRQQISLTTQLAFSQYNHHREMRRSLPPLPPFPKESLILRAKEESTETPT